MPALTCTRKFHICAGHRVMGHENKCAHLHGHNYTIYVTAQAAAGGGLDKIGRVIDFSEIKRRLGTWLEEQWDHGFVLAKDDIAAHCLVTSFVPRPGTSQKAYIMPYNPTAENMARYLLEEICPWLFQDTDITITRVRVWETDNCFADAEYESE